VASDPTPSRLRPLHVAHPRELSESTSEKLDDPLRVEPPAGRGPPNRLDNRDPGDGWAFSPSGERYWGIFGAAGLLAFDAPKGVLLQHRASWSHHGETWGIPGGARHVGESAGVCALREAAEEANVPHHAVRPRLLSVLDLGYWSYTTLVADVVQPFEPAINDTESLELAWTRPDEVADRTLHPGFATSWSVLQPLLEVRPVIIVDAANIDAAVFDAVRRAGVAAAHLLLDYVGRLAVTGVPASALDLPGHIWFPEWEIVVEAPSVAAGCRRDGVEVVRAAASVDHGIFAETQRLIENDRSVTVVTADPELARRVRAVGARGQDMRWLFDQMR
jgi:8-oxo-dGTP diphosphatase